MPEPRHKLSPAQKSRILTLFAEPYRLNATTIAKRMGLKFVAIRYFLELAYGTHFAKLHKNPATSRLYGPIATKLPHQEFNPKTPI